MVDSDQPTHLKPVPNEVAPNLVMVDKPLYQDQTSKPTEVPSNSMNSGQSVDPHLGPNKVLKTPGRQTMIETVLDEDDTEPKPRPMRVPKWMMKKAASMEEQNQKDA